MTIAALLAASLLSPIQPTAWTEVFKGNPSFGYCTSLRSVGGRLLFSDSPAPAATDGGDVYILDRGVTTKVYEVQEQGISVIRSHGNRIYIPGVDATEDWTLGNFYRSTDKGDRWTKMRNIPVAVHVWDIAEWRGDLYVSTGSVRDGKGYAAVCQSSDQGTTWVESLVAKPVKEDEEFARSYVLLPLKDGLYATYVALSNTTGRAIEDAPQDIYKFDKKAWVPLKLFPSPPRLKYFGLRAKVMGDGDYALIGSLGTSWMLKEGVTTQLTGLDGMSVFDFVAAPDGYTYAVATETATSLSALYRCQTSEVAGGQPSFSRFYDLPSGQEGIALEWHDGRLFVGTKASDGGRIFSLTL